MHKRKKNFYELVKIKFIIFTTAGLLFHTVEGVAGNYNRCISKAVTTADTRNCIEVENKVADKQLNESYINLLKLLSLSGQKKLKYSERAWLKFRDAECKFSGHSMEGGTGEYILIRRCYLTMTEERIIQLNKELDFYKKYPTV
ncbi:lysozyme inhibitor LprI family protein [Legionella sp. CNM-4043-24]|uniref:lysozyme inhibitor LprI family protein n=1 Tax=Legionella sp. CNM-4043-24 TaxID=3421646 RepID=UPI00403B35D3